MNKSLVALAAFAVTGVALAQSSVTLYGVVDVALTHGSGSISSRTRLASGSLQTSRIGFRGVEDLGGGLSASFWLESGLNADDGSGQPTGTNNQLSGAPAAAGGGQGLMFNRRSTVSLAGGWGEIRLGRDYVPQFYNLTVADPFLSVSAGVALNFANIITGPTAVRASNSIGYLLPSSLGGFYGQYMHYLGENASNSIVALGIPPVAVANKNDGSGDGIRLGYAQGPFDVAAATGRTRYAAGNAKQSNIYGAWNFDMAKVMANFSRDSNGALNARGYVLGTTVPVAPGLISASWSMYKTDAAGAPKASKIAVGYVHNLSKRTAVYVDYAHLKNSGGAAFALNGSATAANATSNGFDLGLRHSF